MNPSKGIFGSVPDSPDPKDAESSPFKAMANDDEPANPFANPGRDESPFASGSLEPPKPAETAEPKSAGAASPFELAEPEEGFGYDAPESPATAPSSPFAAAPPAEKSPEPEPAPAEPPVGLGTPEPAAPAPTPSQPARPAPAPAPAEPATDSYEMPEIRQLELRAIFGVDRELSAEEILERLRSLAGIRNVARVGVEAVNALDMLRHNLASLGTEAAPMRITFGGSPVEFIRTGNVCLAVMNDGSFAPGVKETIIIAARELARMS